MRILWELGKLLPLIAAIALGPSCGEENSGDEVCANVDCGAHGSCTDGNCNCTDKYTGDRCQYEDASTCALPYRKAATSCTGQGPIAGALPSGEWHGRSLTKNSDGTKVCWETSIVIDQNQIRIESVAGGLQSTAYEQWVFSTDSSAEIRDISGQATGNCTCLTVSCVCEFRGAVSGTRTWLFDRDLLFFSDHFFLDSGFAETHGEGAVQTTCE
jgi:hypothetical protein